MEDVCTILYNTWQLDIKSGIYNLGSANPISHEKLAKLVVDTLKEEKLIDLNKNYVTKVDMPKNLINKFQFLTKAENLPYWISDITKDSKQKIINYIKQLSQRYKHDNKN